MNSNNQLASRNGREEGDLRAKPARMSNSTWELGETTVRLPLGGIASTRADQVRPPIIQPFYLLAGMVLLMIGVFLWLRWLIA